MAEKGVQVNATVPKEWDKAMEDHRWNVRMTKTQLVREYVRRGMIADGLIPDTPQNQPEAQGDTA
jgi:hypothetical protein